MLSKQMKNIIKRTITATFLLFLVYCCWINTFFMAILLCMSMCYILAYEWPLLAQKNKWLWLITPLYIFIPFIICLTYNFSPDRFMLFVCISMVAAFDTGSYLAGNFFGKHLLCPHISPQKTFEGLIGGFIGCFGLWYIGYSYFLPYKTVFIICCLAFLGDLFESWLKRKACIKDTGILLPGHGGLLDRFDSYVFAIYALCFF